MKIQSRNGKFRAFAGAGASAWICVVMLLVPAARAGSDLLAAWGFNEGRGNAILDLSGNAFAGSAREGCTWVEGRTGKTGDYALRLNGRDAYVSIGGLERGERFKALRQFTFEFWVKFDRFPDNAKRVQLAASGREFGIQFHSRRPGDGWFEAVWVDPKNEDYYVLPAGPKHRKLKTGVWTHVAFMMDGRHARLYVDGEPDMAPSYYLKPKAAKEGSSKGFNEGEGAPYEGRIRISSFTLGCRMLGSLAEGWLSGTLDDVLWHGTALRKEELGYFRALDSVVNRRVGMVSTIDIPRSPVTHGEEADPLERIDVIPTPKGMELTRKGVLLNTGGQPRAVIVIPRADETAQAAADAINDGITALGGRALPVKDDKAVANDDVRDMNVILIGGPERNQATKRHWVFRGRRLVAAMPRSEQGYIIETLLHRLPEGGSVFVLAGTGAAGDYYAAATFRELILRQGSDLVAVAGSVRDWPDIENRWVWGNNIRAEQDVVLYSGFKATGWGMGGHPFYMVDRHGQYRDSMKGRAKLHAAACARGMTPCGLINADCTHPSFPFPYGDSSWKEVREGWDCLEDKQHLYCWSRDEMYVKRVRRIAEACKDMHFKALIVHSADTSPGHYWRKRCKRCRERWADDMDGWAKAEAHLAKLTIQELRAVLPELKIIYIFRPYVAGGTAEVDWSQDRAIRIYLDEVPFDENCYVCVREAPRDRIMAWREKWNNMRQFLYLEMIRSKPPCPLYSYRTRLLDSFMGERADDIIWPIIYRPYPDPVNCLMALERMWNKRSCGPGLWPTRGDRDELAAGKPLSAAEDTLLLRVCRKIFGHEAGLHVAEMYRHGLNPTLAAIPTYHPAFTETAIAEYQRQNARAAEKAFAAVRTVLEKSMPLRPEGKRFFPLQYRLALATLTVADARVAISEAERLIAADEDARAEQEVARALKQLTQRQAQLDASDARFKDWPPAYSMYLDGHRTWTELRLGDGGGDAQKFAFDAGKAVEEVREALEKIMANKQAIRRKAAATAASRDLAGKPYPVVRVKRSPGPVLIDGVADDPCWKSAGWIDQFVRNDRLQLSRADTKAALAYDSQALYLFFQCPVHGGAAPVAGSATQDKWTPKDEFVEAMICPDRRVGYYHVFVNPDGVVGDAFAEMPVERSGLDRPESEEETDVTGDELRRRRPDVHWDWNAGIRCRVAKQEGMWSVEAALPLASMAQGRYAGLTLKRGTRWHVNLCRSIPRSALLDTEYASLTRAGYADYWLFPELVFE
ncbi:MAG: hypothetical protein JXR37_20010 [Kiritimatiellae bacterium]|nr:hypothetical protein [Kiritimatiellia bacterium]